MCPLGSAAGRPVDSRRHDTRAAPIVPGMNRFSSARTGPDRVSARWRDTVGAAMRPGWVRSVMVRRAAAVGLVLLAVGLGIVGHADQTARTVLVAAHDLRPGQMLQADDMSPREMPGGLVPGGAIRLSADAVGRTVVARVGAGEIITDTRLLTPRLPFQLTDDPDARLVPVRPADDAVTSLLREGDVVDVLTPEEDVLARAAVVALTAGDGAASGGLTAGPRTTQPILLAMDETAAHRVAAVGLDSALAIVVH